MFKTVEEYCEWLRNQSEQGAEMASILEDMATELRRLGANPDQMLLQSMSSHNIL